MFYHGLVPFHTMDDFNRKCEKDTSTQECVDMYNNAVTSVGLIYQQLKYKNAVE